jgi:hypothetical protein
MVQPPSRRSRPRSREWQTIKRPALAMPAASAHSRSSPDNALRHCEERSDDAIQLVVIPLSFEAGLLRCARNDGAGFADPRSFPYNALRQCDEQGDEAIQLVPIQLGRSKLDCFAALAMTAESAHSRSFPTPRHPSCMDGPLSARLFWCFGKGSGSGHVWTAPCRQGFFGVSAKDRGAVMYTASRCGRWPRALMENADRIPTIAARCYAR